MVQTLAGGITMDPATADDQDAVQYSENAPITGYSIRYYVFCYVRCQCVLFGYYYYIYYKIST